MRSRSPHVAPLLILTAAMGGCVVPSSGPITLWAVGPSHRLYRSSPEQAETDHFSRLRNQIEFAAAANETAQFQLALRGTGGCAVSCDALKGPDRTLPGGTARFWLEQDIPAPPAAGWYVRRHGSAGPDMIPDLLVPLHGAALGGRLPRDGGETQRLWVEYVVPSDAPPGQYLGSIELRRGESVAGRVGVVLTVWPFALPDAPPLDVIAGMDAPSFAGDADREAGQAALGGRLGAASFDAAAASVHRAEQLLREHGLTPCLTRTAPELRFSAEGRVELDWAHYDRLAGPMVAQPSDTETATTTEEKPRRGSRWWPLPVWREYPSAQTLGGGPERYDAVLRQYLEQCRRHVAERTTARLFVDLTAPLPARLTAGDYETLRRLGALARAAAPDAAFVVNTPPVSLAPLGWRDFSFSDLSGVAGIWATPGSYADAAAMQRARGAGAATWLVPDRPPFGGSIAPGADALDARCVAWHAFLQGSDLWLPRVTGAEQNHPLSSSGAASEALPLLYRTGRGAQTEWLPSLRLKLLHRGIQDAAYLRALDQMHRGGAARLVAQSLVQSSGAGTYVDCFADADPAGLAIDPDWWELGRRLLAEEWMDAGAGMQAAEDRRTEPRLGWSRFLSAARPLRVAVDSARWVDEITPGGPELRLTMQVTLDNRRTSQVSGRLSFGTLPEGWTPIEDDIPVGPLSEWSRGRFRLVLRAAALPLSADGHVVVPIRLALEGGETIERQALVSTMAASPAPRTITIDGRLDDWAIAPGSAAANFLRVGGDRSGDAPPAAFAARATTLAYACRDGQSACFAIRAANDDSGRREDSRGNRPAYDDLVPMGQDLVELLIDPGNGAAESGDLYHLVLSRGGGMWAEQGISAPQPIGRRRPWGLDVEYATRRDGTGWTVEVRIPLSSLSSSTSPPGRVWGVNFSRFAAGSAEYSSWSGAARYCYNPWSLGNMAWQEPSRPGAGVRAPN